MLNQVVSKTLTRPGKPSSARHLLRLPAATARRLVNASLSDNTRRAYAGALGQLDAWLDRLIVGQGFHLVVGRQWLVALSAGDYPPVIQRSSG